MDTESHFISVPESQPSQFSRKTVIAEGSTSICYKVMYDGKWYSKKVLRPELKDLQTYQNILRKEYEIGSLLDSPFIVHYSDIGEDSDGLYVLTDYVDGTSLADMIKLHPEFFKSRSVRRQFINELLKAVECLHQHQVLHLDIKPENIMITTIGNHVKLIDCGFSYQDCFTQSVGGTEGYSAPELFNGSYKLGTYSDIYSIGCILKELDIANAKILARCLDNNPQKRYQQIEDLRNAIFNKTKIYVFAAVLIVLMIASTYLYANRGMFRTPEAFSTLRVPEDFSTKMHVRTLVIDRRSQPPLVGGYIENIDTTNVLAKGLMIGTNKNDLFFTDTTMNTINLNNSLIIPQGYSIIGNTMTVLHCKKINKDEFLLPLLHLLGDKDYYIKAFVYTKRRRYIYGKLELIHTLDYNRFGGNADVANVFYAYSNTAFDLVTDEIIGKNDRYYYSSNEKPKICSPSRTLKGNDFYKFKTKWNYSLWYSFSGLSNSNFLWKGFATMVYWPVMELKNGKLYISKDNENANDSIKFYYTINGNWKRPENFRLRYTKPIAINRPCLVSCYGIRSDGYISQTNYYKVFPEQLKGCSVRR